MWLKPHCQLFKRTNTPENPYSDKSKKAISILRYKNGLQYLLQQNTYC